ncbi:hypothetical protein [Winogradskya humida]|uniref:hypothetical protein n=1 Tax=Winogradskya humida TaxID=113566 RepID=UPI001941AF94|nr:hypothetical protein [Actinoplanes humidus]
MLVGPVYAEVGDDDTGNFTSGLITNRFGPRVPVVAGQLVTGGMATDQGLRRCKAVRA